MICSASGAHYTTPSPSSSSANSTTSGSGSGGNDDVSLATLEGLTDLLPMMPHSEVIKLSLKDLDTAADLGNEKPVLSELSPPLPGWGHSGGDTSSNYSTMSLTPPPLVPSSSSSQPSYHMLHQQARLSFF